jgi:hypothetical protein
VHLDPFLQLCISHEDASLLRCLWTRDGTTDLFLPSDQWGRLGCVDRRGDRCVFTSIDTCLDKSICRVDEMEMHGRLEHKVPV